jgi:predicted PurR-regulated permease PerM
VFLLVLLVAVGGLSYLVLRPFFAGILWASVVAVALWPLWARVRARAGKRQGLAAGLFSLAIALVVLLPASLLGLAVVNQASEAAAAVGARLKARDVHSWSDVFSNPVVDRGLAWLHDSAGVSTEDLQSKVAIVATHASSILATAGGAAVLTFLDILLTFIVTLFLLFFLLRDGEEMVEALTDLIPIDDAERRRIVRSLGGMMESIFKGSLVCAIVQGVSGGLSWVGRGTAVGRSSRASPWGSSRSSRSAGPRSSGPRRLVVLLVQGRTGTAIAFLLWNVLVTSTLADNVLQAAPDRSNKGGELSTLLVFLGVFGGLAAFGLLGIFIGPMTLAVAVMLVRILREMARASREANAGA